MDTDVFNGFPTHIEKAGGLLKISLQKDHKLGIFVESYLHDNLKELKSSRFIPKRDDLIPLSLGIGQFDDKQYYRIQILEHLPNNLVNVLFIDYGNIASLPLSDIRLLNYEVHKALLNIPALAITCYLENVWVSKPWSDDELNTLKKLVLYEEKRCIVRQLHPKVKVVNIFFPNASKKLTELILENDLGTPISDTDLLDAVKRMRNNRLGSISDERSQTLAHQFSSRLTTIPDSFIPERITQSREQITLKNFSSAHMLPVGSSHNAYISHMKDGPYSFSIQLKSSAEDALPRLTRLLKQADPVLNNRPLLPGTMVMTRYHPDNSFRRSIVMDVQSNMCQVYHTDFGSTEEVPFSEIYELPSQAHHAPSMALRFCLADIKKTQVTEASKVQFQELLQGKQVLIRVVKQESEGPLLQYCEMFYEGRNVKDILVAFNAPVEYTIQQPPRGKDLKVTVSHIESPSMFFIQYNSKLDLLNNIQDAVNNYCKHQPRLKDMSGINIGSPVAALFEDNVWYRAMILSLGTESAQVSYVDYGNRCEVFMSQLCQISRDLVTKWRTQAVECCLNGFENENINDANEQVIAMMEETLNVTYNMTPIKILSTNRLLVELIDEVGNKISEKIKSLKHPKHLPATNLSVAQIQEPPVSPIISSSELESLHPESKKISKGKEKNDNMFVRPSVRPIIEQQNKTFSATDHFTSNKPYSQHDDRCDDLSKKSHFQKSPRFKVQESSRRNSQENRKPPAESWADISSHDLNTTIGSNSSRTPSRESFSKGNGFGRNTSNDENDHRRTKFSRSDGASDGWSSEKPKFGDRTKFANRGSKFSDTSDESWNDTGSDKYSKDERPKRNGTFGKFNDRKTCDWESERSGSHQRKFGSDRKVDENEKRYGGRRIDGESGGRFGKRVDGESGGKFRRREDGESAGRFGRREGNEDIARLVGGKRDNGEHVGRFGSRKNDHESSSSRFENKAGERFGNHRRDDADKRGGKFWDNETGGGRRDGAKFGKESSKKKFERATDGGFKSGVSTALSEEWGEDVLSTVTTPVTEAPKTASSSYPIPSITPHSELPVIMTSFLSPHHFYVQHIDSQSELDELKTLIDNMRNEILQFKIDLLAPGVPLLAKYSEDQTLYRGIVKNLVSSNEANILFVDYGNSEVVHSKDLYFIPTEILNKAPLAFCCRVSDVKPVNDQWADSSAFDSYFNGEDILTLSVSSLKMIDGEMIVNVTVKTSEGDFISQKLIDGGLAVSSSSITTGSVSSEKISEPRFESLRITTTNLNQEDIEKNINCLDKKKALDKWIDRMDLLKNQTLYGKLLESVNDRLFVISILDAKVVTLATLADHQSPSCVTPGIYVIAEVLEVLDDKLKITLFNLDGMEMGPFSEEREARFISPVCKFPVVRRLDCVTVTHVEDNRIFITRLADCERLSILLEEMFNFYEEKTQDLSEKLVTGNSCAAKSLADDNWYRAEIINYSEKYKVRYIDYGNTEELPPENIKLLDSCFFFPALALDVTLPFSYKSNDTQLIDAFIGVEFYCTLAKDNQGQWVAELTDTCGKNLADILSELCEIELNAESPLNEVNSGIGSYITAGDTLPVLVTHTDSPTLFWVQKQSDIKTVDLLHNNLQEVVPTCDAVSDLDVVFAAKFAADGLWYRATKVSSDSLRFIDYGNTDFLTEAKKLPEYMQKPVSGYAIPMYLCAKPINGSWPDEAIKEFQMFIETEIVAEIKNVNYKIIADLRQGDRYLSKILVDAGYATYCDYIHEIVKKYTLNIDDSFSFRMSPILNPNELKVMSMSEKVKVFISHINSVKDFYVQEESKSSEIEEITSQLNKLENEPCLSEVEIGSIIAAKFEDGVWYRARVVSNDPEIKVFFIDFGNTFVSTELRGLPDNLTDKGPLAINCSLDVEESGNVLENLLSLSDEGTTQFYMVIKSHGAPSIVDLFDKNGVNILSSLSYSQNVDEQELMHYDANSLSTRQKIYITHVYGPDSFYAQTRELVIKSDEMTSEMLLAETFEKLTEITVGDVVAALYPEDGCWYRGQLLSSAPDIVVRFIDYGNTSVVTELRDLPPYLKTMEPLIIKCALQLPEGFESWSEDCIELFNSICINNSDSLEVEFISESLINYVELFVEGDPVTKNLIPRLMTHNLSPKIENDKQVKGYITHINSVSDFYIQREDCAEFLRPIQSGLSVLENNPQSKPNCGIGSVIAAKFIDGEWYRGQILQIDPELRVRFIDYGNECNVSEISALSEELIQIPPMVIKCSLDIKGNSLKDNAKKLFEKYCGDTHFDFSIKSVVDDLSYVEIILEGENILNKLISDTDLGNLNQNDETMYNNALIQSRINEDTRHSDDESFEKCIRGYISHINSIHDFYIQEENLLCQLEEIVTKLAESESSEVPLNMNVSDLVCAKSEEDGNWYRAEITKIDPHLSVKFIDYGNESNVSEVRKLSNDLVELPAIAFKCSLHMHDKNVFESANESFIKLCGFSEQLFDFKIVSCFDGVNEVEIYLNGIDISLELHKMRMLSTLPCNTESGEKIESKDLNNSEFLEPCDIKDTKQDSFASNKELSKDVCNTNVSQKACEKCEPEKEIIKSNQSNVSSNQGKQMSDQVNFCFPTRNNLISSVNSITDFFLTPDSSELNHVVEVLEGADLFDEPLGICVGDVLAGKHVEGLWYRCRVDEVISETEYKVFLIDYGYTVRVSELKKLPPELISIGPAAFNCSLLLPEGIEFWPEKTCDKFMEIKDTVIGYEMVDNSVSPYIVKLLTNLGDLSTQLTDYFYENENALEGEKSIESKTPSLGDKEGFVENEQEDILKNVQIKDSNLKSEKNKENVTVNKVNANKVSSVKTSPTKSVLQSKVKTVAEIKANAKSKINSLPSPQKTVDRLQKPLFVKTNLDEKPVPGSISNPSSPVTDEISTSKSLSEPCSPHRSITDERIVPGVISSGTSLELPNAEELSN